MVTFGFKGWGAKTGKGSRTCGKMCGDVVGIDEVIVGVE